MKRGLLSGILLFVLLCCGCGKEELEENRKNFSELISVYPEEKMVMAYTADQEGYVYTVSTQDGKYNLYQYDENQKLSFQYVFDDSIGNIHALSVENGTIYFAAERTFEQGILIFSLFMETKEIKSLAKYDFFDTVRQMFLQDGRLYLLGARNYSLNAQKLGGNDGYYFCEDKLIYYVLEEGESYGVEIKYPINMAFTENGKLMVHAYVDKEGYQMLEYDPVQDSIKSIAAFENYQIGQFAVCNDGKNIIYCYDKNSRGLVLAPLSNLNDEAELCTFQQIASPADIKVFYQNGKVYLLNRNYNVMSFPLADLYHENKTIRYIAPGFQIDAPYGCGYMMQREELSEDKFVLKILAQDTDYDLCLIDTINYKSYDLKKNDMFYPLNDVPGVEEYLDQCFPYVKEAATKEDGTIWMIPVAVYMPGLVVQEDTLKELGVPLRRDMTWLEFASMLASIPKENQELLLISRTVCSMLFFQQYFQRYHSIDQEAFRQNAAALQTIDPDLKFLSYREDKRFLFYYCRYVFEYTSSALRELYYGEDAKIYPMPRLSSTDHTNTATCILLAVNPASDRLQETLSYISDYVNWQMSEKEAPLFFKEPVPEPGSFDEEIYTLYQNGEIAFTLDHEAYINGFYDMLDGKKSLEDYIDETEQKLKIYFGE